MRKHLPNVIVDSMYNLVESSVVTAMHASHYNGGNKFYASIRRRQDGIYDRLSWNLV